MKKIVARVIVCTIFEIVTVTALLVLLKAYSPTGYQLLESTVFGGAIGLASARTVLWVVGEKAQKTKNTDSQ